MKLCSHATTVSQSSHNKESLVAFHKSQRRMVCDRCEKKLSTIITPDTWKDGSRNAKTGKMGRKVNVNMLSSKFGKNKRYVVALFFFRDQILTFL